MQSGEEVSTSSCTAVRICLQALVPRRARGAWAPTSRARGRVSEPHFMPIGKVLWLTGYRSTSQLCCCVSLREGVFMGKEAAHRNLYPVLRKTVRSRRQRVRKKQRRGPGGLSR